MKLNSFPIMQKMWPKKRISDKDYPEVYIQYDKGYNHAYNDFVPIGELEVELDWIEIQKIIDEWNNYKYKNESLAQAIAQSDKVIRIREEK